MAEIVVATLTIDFESDDAQGTLMLEEIGEDDGGVKGDYVMYQGNIELLEHGIIGGSFTETGDFEREVDEFITFSNSSTTSLPYPVNRELVLTQIGPSYKVNKKTGAVTQVELGTPVLQEDGVTLKVGVNALAVFKATYIAVGDRFRASSSMPVVMVFAVGKVS